MTPEEIGARVTHVHGLATCHECGALVSWLLPWPERDRVSELRCPLCKNACQAHAHSAHAIIATSPATEA